MRRLIRGNAPAPKGTGHALIVMLEDSLRGGHRRLVLQVAASRGGGVDCHTGYAMDIAAYNVLVSTQDRIEGVAAFSEKRPPVWRNR